MLLEAHFPAFVGFGQFRPHILPLEKQANGIRTREMLCIPKKLVERCTGTGRHHIEGLTHGCLHTFVADDYVKAQPVTNRLEKLTLLGGRLE